jgi:hypothetical protein
MWFPRLRVRPTRLRTGQPEDAPAGRFEFGQHECSTVCTTAGPIRAASPTGTATRFLRGLSRRRWAARTVWATRPGIATGRVLHRRVGGGAQRTIRTAGPVRAARRRRIVAVLGSIAGHGEGQGGPGHDQADDQCRAGEQSVTHKSSPILEVLGMSKAVDSVYAVPSGGVYRAPAPDRAVARQTAVVERTTHHTSRICEN